MTDKELLDLAAKAANIPNTPETGLLKTNGQYWNPLADDGDALRLAVKLHLSMDLFDDFIDVSSTPNDNSIFDIKVPTLQDPCAATRRAITRAAAQIGRVSQ